MAEESSEEKDYQEAGRSTADYAEYQKPEKPRNPIWKKLGIGLLALILIAVLGAGGYWFAKQRKDDKKVEQSSQITQNASSATDQINTETKHFDSANFKLGFDYPGDWTASEDSPTEISVLSKDLKLKDVDGKDVTGQIYFRVRAKGQKISGFGSGNAVAVLDSEKIAYANPTEVQRASTFITFLRYPENDAGLDAVYITGDQGYQADQDVMKADIENVDPIISVEFYLCPNSGCKEISGVYGIGAQTWDNDNISMPVKAMLESLVIN